MRKKVPTWSPLSSVENALLDEQHQKLLAICEKAANLLDHNSANEEEIFHNVLNDFFTASNLHTKTEEDILHKHHYPSLAEHKKEHERRAEQLTDIVVKATQGDTSKEELYKLLHDWVTVHELGADMEYKEYLRKH